MELKMNTDKKIALSTFKTDIKLVAEFTRQYKKAFKEWQRTGDTTSLKSTLDKWFTSTCKLSCFDNTTSDRICVFSQEYLRIIKRHVRHMHVAYSLLKGRTIDQIEQHSESELNADIIKVYIKKYTGSDELVNSFNLGGDTSFFKSVLNRIKEACHV